MKRLAALAIVGVAAWGIPAAAHADGGVPTADMGVTATGPDKARPGQSVEYTLQVTNHGKDAAPTFLHTNLPRGASEATYDDRPVVGNRILINTLKVGETKTLKVQAKLGTDNNEVNLVAGFTVDHAGIPLYNEPNWFNNSAHVQTANEAGDPEQGPNARLAATGKVEGEVKPGKTLTYTLTITNTGVHRATGFEVMGMLRGDSGQKIKSVTGLDGGRGATNETGLRYGLPALGKGQQRVITVTTTVGPEAKPGALANGWFMISSDNGGDQEIDLRR